jgi:thioredoxin 1
MSIVIYHFWSPTCGPCKVIKPAIEDIKEEFSEIPWVSVNTHDDPNGFARRFSVNVVPTMVVTKNDMEVGRHSGTNIILYYTLIRKAKSA